MKPLSENKKLWGLCGILGGLILLCAISLVFLAVNGAKPLPQKESENTAQIKPPSSAILSDTPDYGQSYTDSIIFLGDSTCAGLSELSKDQIWTGISGSLSLDINTSSTPIVYPQTDAKMTVGEAAALKKPDYMIITLGINNGVSYCNEEKFKAYYSKLLDSIIENSSNTKIILQSIFPVSKQFEKSEPSLSNEKIDRANGWIISLAEQYGLRYLDTASVLKNGDGMLDKNYDSGDGMHLNTEGSKRVIDYIRTHGYQ